MVLPHVGICNDTYVLKKSLGNAYFTLIRHVLIQGPVMLGWHPPGCIRYIYKQNHRKLYLE